MSDYFGPISKLQAEQVGFRDAISEGTAKQLAAAINAALLNVNKAAVGEIEYSMLTLTQFQAEKGEGWVLANGAPLPPGSLYASIIGGTNVPDLGGYFFRMKANGSVLDPNAVANNLGGFEANSVHQHLHNGVISSAEPGKFPLATNETADQTDGGTYGAAAFPVAVNLYSFTIDPSGGNESRPRCVTVNVFIKIN